MVVREVSNLAITKPTGITRLSGSPCAALFIPMYEQL